MARPNLFHPLACPCVHCTEDEVNAGKRCEHCGKAIEKGVLCWPCTDDLFEEVRKESDLGGASASSTPGTGAE